MFKTDLADTSVKEIMRRWPETVPVFLRHRMRCPGCLLAPFMTLAEAAAEHGVEMDALRRDIARTIEQTATGEGAQTA
jgi:hybrid cluster-associated redox disulfide protein